MAMLPEASSKSQTPTMDFGSTWPLLWDVHNRPVIMKIMQAVNGSLVVVIVKSSHCFVKGILMS
jgi:hypothetical protein